MVYPNNSNFDAALFGLFFVSNAISLFYDTDYPDHSLCQQKIYSTTHDFSLFFAGRETEWKTFATDHVHLDYDDLQYFATLDNPVLNILNECCGDWSVDYLYTALVESGAGGIADRYL